jgi:hypothetical protein
MRIAVLQPSYLPWLGYLHQIAAVDAFVFYDDVQFDKNGWRNRNRIRTEAAQGWDWLTIPVLHAGHLSRICDVRIDPRATWRRKHAMAITVHYGKADRFELYKRYIATLYTEDESSLLVDVAIRSVRVLLEAFGICTELYRSSRLDIAGDRNTRLLNICRYFGAKTYLSGIAAKAYLDELLFAREGITVEWQHFDHPVYPQALKPFVSHLSALDALLCVGPESVRFFQKEVII